MITLWLKLQAKMYLMLCSVIIDANDVEKGTLNITSNIRPNKLFTADKNIVLYKICSLKKDKLDVIINKVVDIFRDKTN